MRFELSRAGGAGFFGFGAGFAPVDGVPGNEPVDVDGPGSGPVDVNVSGNEPVDVGSSFEGGSFVGGSWLALSLMNFPFLMK